MHSLFRSFKTLGFLCLAVLLSFVRAAPAADSPSGQPRAKPRLLVLTDIGGDPDDQQSMIRLMTYANEFEIEGLIERFFQTAQSQFEAEVRAGEILTLPWLNRALTEGLARLRYLVEHATLGLVLGASGLGKSALVKRFLHEVRGPACLPIYLHSTHLSSSGLLKLLVTALGEPPSRGKDRLFAQIVQRARSAEARPLIVLDEAHLLDADSLTDLRLLVSSALDDAPPETSST